MNTWIKNLLWIVIVIVLVVGAFVLFRVSSVYDRSSEPTNFRSFTVQGDGKAVAVPDVSGFSFDVITEGGSNLATLQTENATKMNAAIAYVQKQGIDKKDISTTQYRIQPRYEIISCDYGSGKPCPPAKIVGYTVQQTAHIKIRDFSKISGLLAGVVTSGANSVSDLQFVIDDKTEVENIARTEAIKKAQEKAKSVAAAAGFSLGRLLEINESWVTPYYGREMLMAKTMDSEESVAPTIEPGSQEVSISVSLKYEIQ